MKHAILIVTLLVVPFTGCATQQTWVVDATGDWTAARAASENLTFNDDKATPTAPTARYRSAVHAFDRPRSLQRIEFTQSPEWLNWQPIENLGPANLGDAPVLLAKGPGDYWMFGRYSRRGIPDDFQPQPVTLDGFDIPLTTTPFANQYDAPGGRQPGLGGYHAWQSRDMVHWVHHGPVTERFSKWVTTAEYADGKTYIYYDYPNDQDPHVYIDDDLTDGKPGTNAGLAFADPSDGSDCTVIRDLAGNFHVIYEDWSPINARQHSWDSPLAGHAVSKTGKGPFTILPPAVDQRTTPTGQTATYLHPHWKREHPDWHSNVATYQVHEPEQNAYGDWAAIAIGGQYYLFCDVHPAGERIRVGWFTSESIDQPFRFAGELGLGHPDPDIIFANGKFYLATQMKTDYISSGPWVDTVEARVGVDTTGDGKIDQWTTWQTVREQYEPISGYAKQIARTPAAIDLTNLPPAHGVAFEYRTNDTTANASQPIIDRVTVTYE